MVFICLVSGCSEDALVLLHCEGGGTDNANIMPSEALGLSEVLEFLNIGGRVG